MIKIQNLNFGYDKPNNLYQNLQLQIPKGHICGILGVNGAGKSTLLKLMSGLIFPTSGIVAINNHQPQKREISFLQNIYFIPETIQLPKISSQKFVKHYADFYPKFCRPSFENYLQEFNLPPSKQLTALSHGQQKKFALAFAFATQAEILLLDEPSNGLDIPGKQALRKILAASSNAERSILIATHQVKDIENLIDLVTIIDSGKILFQQPMAAVQNNLQNKQEDTLPAEEHYIYAEKSLNGFNIIAKNTSGISSDIDLELLFNVATKEPEKLNKVFI